MTNSQIEQALRHAKLPSLMNEINAMLAESGKKARLTYYQMRLLKHDPGSASAWARDLISDYYEGELDTE